MPIKMATLPTPEAPHQDRDGDLKGISPTELRMFDLSRLGYIAALEKENTALRGEVAALRARLAEHDRVIATVKAMGETPWVTAAKKGASLG